MPIYTALTTLEGEAAARALSAALERMDPEPYGVGIFDIEDGSGRWEVGGYFHEEPDGIILEILATAFGAASFAVSEVPEVDWVARVQRELHPVDAGRFFVYGSHDRARVPPGRVALEIEASMAFGTGHHATTLGCLLAFDALYEAGVRPANVADIGAGTAVLAMAAAKMLPEARILASDIDPVAVEVSRVNLAVNGLEGRVTCVEAAGFDHVTIRKAAPFDLVFANILKGPLVELSPDMARHVAPGGRVILSGLLVVQAESVIDAYVTSGFRLHSRNDLGEWSALVLLRG
jgi:ribosomal protein L11 methyltransferase